MNNRLRIGFAFSLCLLFTGPSWASGFCSPENAESLGYHDALQGRSEKPGLARSATCNGAYSTVTFAKDYMAGFMKAQREVCTREKAEDRARADLNAGHGPAHDEQLFPACESMREEMQRAYRGVFAAKSCDVETAKDWGKSAGQSLSEPTKDAFKVCASSKRAKLQLAYDEGYKSGVKESCSPIEAQSRGIQDAEKNLSLGEGLSKWKVCPLEIQEAVASAYTRGYNTTHEQKMREKQIDEENRLRRQALDVEERRAGQPRFITPPTTVIVTNPSRLTGGEQSFSNSGHRFYANCSLQGSRVAVQVRNPDRAPVVLRGPWELSLYDFRGGLQDRRIVNRSLSFGLGSLSSFWVPVPVARRSSRCMVLYKGR